MRTKCSNPELKGDVSLSSPHSSLRARVFLWPVFPTALLFVYVCADCVCVLCVQCVYVCTLVCKDKENPLFSHFLPYILRRSLNEPRVDILLVAGQ